MLYSPMKGVKHMANLFIQNIRNGYAPDQCGNTMTVAELIEYLEQFEEDTKVYISNDNGYTYSPIRENSFFEE